MAPVYFDELNMVENIHHHYRSLGGYTFAFFDYYYAGVTEYLDSAAFAESLTVMDVLTFKERYAKFQTNYLINAGNDEFFLLGNPLYYFDKLSAKTLLRVIPNQSHGGVSGGRKRRDGEKLKLPIVEPRDIPDLDSLWLRVTQLKILYVKIHKNNCPDQTIFRNPFRQKNNR